MIECDTCGLHLCLAPASALVSFDQAFWCLALLASASAFNRLAESRADVRISHDSRLSPPKSRHETVEFALCTVDARCACLEASEKENSERAGEKAHNTRLLSECVVNSHHHNFDAIKANGDFCQDSPPFIPPCLSFSGAPPRPLAFLFILILGRSNTTRYGLTIFHLENYPHNTRHD